MIISDLNYLEVVSEASSVVGGGKKFGFIKFLKLDIDITKQSNVSVINQKAEANAVSLGKGDAIAVASNVAVVTQSNKNY